MEDIEIFAHVLGVGGPGKGHHADIDGEPENDRSAIRISWRWAVTLRLAVSSEKP